jgi:hypothetical protein
MLGLNPGSKPSGDWDYSFISSRFTCFTTIVKRNSGIQLPFTAYSIRYTNQYSELYLQNLIPLFAVISVPQK